MAAHPAAQEHVKVGALQDVLQAVLEDVLLDAGRDVVDVP